MYNDSVLPREREHLRELAKKQLELARLDIMKVREARWYAHNECKSGAPMIIVESDTFLSDILPEQKCETPLGRRLEKQLLENIASYSLDDDRVIPDFLTVPWDIDIDEFGLELQKVHASNADSSGNSVAFQYVHPIEDIDEDFHKLSPARFGFDREHSLSRLEAANSVLGDILPVKLDNAHHTWSYMLTCKAVNLMGLENWLITLASEPDNAKKLLRYLTDNLLSMTDFYEKNGLFTSNCGNTYAGAGSRGYSKRLEAINDAEGKVTPRGMWVNLNSQESSSISPEMYKELIFPFYRELAERFGAVYYGCCEPVHTIWDLCLKDLPNLKKVSVSPWCDVNFMGERLRGSGVIFSRKPNPKFLGVGSDFDADEFRSYISETVCAARGCTLEIIFRDVYTLGGNFGRIAKALRILRESIEKNWY